MIHAENHKKGSAIIVAGGSGTRMGTGTRKQYLLLGGKPIISHTLLKFDKAASIHQLVLVVPQKDLDVVKKDIIPSLNLSTPVHLTAGGKTRQDSVYQGLLRIEDLDGIVAIHDGVRPFISPHEIDQCVQGARAGGACIMGIPITDTIKQSHGNNRVKRTIDRNHLWLAQTPQAFQYQMIRRAYESAREDGVAATDDAMLVERMGEPVTLLLGNRRNIKITTPEDLLLADAFLKIRSRASV